jgi:hypothetical protein
MRDRTAEFKGANNTSSSGSGAASQRRPSFAARQPMADQSQTMTRSTSPNQYHGSNSNANPFFTVDLSDDSPTSNSSGRTSATLGWAPSANKRATNTSNTDIELGRIAVSEDQNWLPEFLREVRILPLLKTLAYENYD